MTQITQFTRGNCRVVAGQITAALATLEEQLGVKIADGAIKFGSGNMKLTLEVSVAAPDGEVKLENTPDGEAFRFNASFYGLSPSDLGRSFRYRGDLYTLKGAKPRASKYPLIAERMADGKSYKFTAEIVRGALK